MFLKPQKAQPLKVEKSGGLWKLFQLFQPKVKTEINKEVEERENKELLESLKVAQNEWMTAIMNFEFAKEDSLVDYYTYKIKACEVRYEYLLKKAKEKGVKVEGVEMNGSRI